MQTALARKVAHPLWRQSPIASLIAKPCQNQLRWTQPGMSGGLPRGSLRGAVLSLGQWAQPREQDILLSIPPPWSALPVHVVWEHGAWPQSEKPPAAQTMAHISSLLPASDFQMWTDGAHVPGSAKGGCGFVITQQQQIIIANASSHVQCATAFAAEVKGLALALQYLSRGPQLCGGEYCVNLCGQSGTCKDSFKRRLHVFGNPYSLFGILGFK